MITAFGFSTLFLVSYILHHALHGDVRYPAHAALRIGLPAAARQPHHPRHRRAAAGAGHVLLFAQRAAFRSTARSRAGPFPLWLYVSVTGVITYVMLRLAQG